MAFEQLQVWADTLSNKLYRRARGQHIPLMAGTDAAIYLSLSAKALTRTPSNAYSPSSIAIAAFTQTNGEPATAYLGRFIISTSTDGFTFTPVYTSAGDESSTSYAPSGSTLLVLRVALYRSGGTTELLDRQDISVSSIPTSEYGLRSFATAALVQAAVGRNVGERVYCVETGSLWECLSLPSTWVDLGYRQPSAEGLAGLWRGDEHKDIPDDPAGVTQGYSAFASTSMVDASSGVTLSVENGKLKLTITATSWYIQFLAVASILNKTLRVAYSATAGRNMRLFATGGTATQLATQATTGLAQIIDGYNTVANTRLMLNCVGWTIGDVVYISSEYVGTGAYLSKIVDNSGQGMHVSPQGLTPVDTAYGRAVSFDGVNDYALLDITKDTWTGAFTWCFRVQGKASRAASQFLYSRSTGADGGQGIDIYIDSTNKAVIRIAPNGSAATRVALLAPTGSEITADCMLAFEFIPSTSMRILKDGAEIASLTTGVPSLSYYSASQTATFGAHGPSHVYPLNGWLSGILIYTRALTDSEHRGYALGLLPQTSYDANYWKLEQAASDNVIAPSEKKGILAAWNAIDGGTTGSYRTTLAKATAVSVSTTALTTARDNLYAQLYTSPGVLVAATWDNIIPIVKATYLGLWAAYYSAESEILGEIALRQALRPSAEGLAGLWRCDELPAIPDDPAGVTYLANWASGVDGWTSWQATLSVSGGILRATMSAASGGFNAGKTLSPDGKTVRVRVRANKAMTGRLYAYGSSPSTYKEISLTTYWQIVDFYFPAVSGTQTQIYIPSGAVLNDWVEISFAYIGTGAYLSKVVDNSGQSLHASPQGVTPVDTTWGRAVSFDGVNDYALLDTTKDNWTGAFTRCFRVQGKARTAYQALYHRDSGTPYFGIRCGINVSNQAYFAISGNGTVLVALAASAGTEITADCTLSFEFIPSTSMRILKDGKEIAALLTGVPALAYYSASQVAQFGAHGPTRLYPLDGWLSGIAFYTRALSVSEHRGYALGLLPDVNYSQADWKLEPTNPQNAVASYAPAYLGKYLDSAPTAHAIGDVYTRYSLTPGAANRGVFKWDGSAWVRTETRADIMQAGADIAFIIAKKDASGTAIYGTAADYTSDSAIQADYAFFQSAVIGFLEAYEITVRNRVKTSDGYAFLDNQADAEDDVKGVGVATVPVADSPANGTYLLMTNLFNIFGSRIPGLIWKSKGTSAWENLSYIFFNLVSLIIKNVWSGASLTICDLDGHFQFSKSATANSAGTEAIIDADQVNASLYGVKKRRGFLSGTTYTRNDVFDALSPFVPNTGNAIVCVGGIKVGVNHFEITEAERYDATTIRMYGYVIGGGPTYYDMIDGNTGALALVALTW